MLKNEMKDCLPELDEKLSACAYNLGAAVTCFEMNDDYGMYSAKMSFRSFDVYFMFENNITSGYSFMENYDSELIGAGLITRFKFGFSEFYYSPYDIQNTIEDNEFCTLDFHFLIDKNMVQKSADVILGFISKNAESISRISDDLLLQNRLVDCFERDMAVASKKITKQKLDKNMKKYMEKHETNMYLYHFFDCEIFNFVLGGSQSKLEKYFANQSAKNKLLVIEQRYCDYLINHDFPRPDSDSLAITKKVKEHGKKNSIYKAICIICAAVCTIVFELSISKIVDMTILRDYFVVYEKDAYSIDFIINTLAFWGVISIAVKKLFFRNEKIGTVFLDMDNKKHNAIVLLLATVLLIGGGVFEYYSQQCVVALGEQDIYYRLSFSQAQKIDYADDRIEFIMVEGYTEEDENGKEVYYDSSEDKTLYFVFDGDYESSVSTDLFDKDIYDVIDILNKHGKSIESFKDYQQFSEKYDIE